MDTAVFPDQAEYAFELVGVFTFALSGAMVAVRRDFDVVGIVVLAGLTALGGGVIRDVLIGATPPYVFSHVDLLLVPLAASLVVVFAHSRNSLAFFAGCFGLTTRRSPPSVIWVIGVKSFTG